MADQKAPQMQATLGLTGLTANAMALIAPGAFLWLTFVIQAHTGVAGQPSTAPAMWIGIFAALLLCLATAVAYAEISKLYPGTGSSYYYAEQAMLSKDKAFKYARISKFIVGWGSHLYYWVYPGVMVAVTGIFVGYVIGFLFPSFMSGSNPGPVLHGAGRGRLLVLRGVDRRQGRGRIDRRQSRHQRDSNLRTRWSSACSPSAIAPTIPTARPASSTTTQTLATYSYQFATAKDGTTMRDSSGNPLPLLDAAGKPVPFVITYPTTDSTGNFLTHPNAASVIGVHKFSYMFIQATVAILILVGFESVTSMGGEAKNPTKHIPIAVIASLLIQGLFCYLFEYFCANYFLNSGYTMQSAVGSAAPIGDMMIIVGDALLGQGHGKYFMQAEAFTVFLALIGTTLACMNTGARVTYAMGKDEEVPSTSACCTPSRYHRARPSGLWPGSRPSSASSLFHWSSATPARRPTPPSRPCLTGIFSSFGYLPHDTLAKLPNSLLAITLTSNFGTFILYALSCFLCMVAYNKSPGSQLPAAHV